MQLSACWVFPFGLYGVNGQITSYEMDLTPEAKEIPMLISNTVQRRLRLQLSLGDGVATPDEICFKAWGDETYRLEKAPNGNPASSLLHFDDEGHPGVSGLAECYAVVLEPTFDQWDGGDGQATAEDETSFQTESAVEAQHEDDQKFVETLKGGPDVSITPDQADADLPGGCFDVGHIVIVVATFTSGRGCTPISSCG